MNLWDRWSRLTEAVAGSRPGAGDRDAVDSLVHRGDARHRRAAGRRPRCSGRAGTACRLLDVGGGPATYTLAFVKAVPGLTATLFDLPAVIELARGNVAATGSSIASISSRAT